ncbi:MAG: hypothetical protein ACTXOO_01555 [Sodalis sp. (in: enterobacteria)]
MATLVVILYKKICESRRATLFRPFTVQATIIDFDTLGRAG